MNRRGFLGALLGAVASQVIPSRRPPPITLNLDAFAELYVRPAADAIANSIDQELAQQYALKTLNGMLDRWNEMPSRYYIERDGKRIFLG